MSLPPHLQELAARVSNWGRWGADDRRGTLNLIDNAALRRGLAAARQCHLQPSYCTTAGAEIAAFEPGVETVSLCLAFLCASISSAIVTVS